MEFNRNNRKLKKDFKDLIEDLIENLDGDYKNDKEKIIQKLKDLENFYKSLNDNDSRFFKWFSRLQEELDNALGGKSD